MAQDFVEADGGDSPANLTSGSGGSLGLGWSYFVDERPRGLRLRLSHPNQAPMQIEVAITRQGPVIRASATALEIEAVEEISASCERFSIDARDRVSLRAREIVQEASATLCARAGEVQLTATNGDVTLRANDDVQLLGEQVLLNCDRDVDLPGWVPSWAGAAAASAEATLPRQDEGGDAALLASLERK